MDDHIIPVFDLGGVFVDWNPMYLFRKLFDSEEDAQWFHDHICTGDWNLEFDAGEIYAEGVAKLVTRFPKYWREIKAYDERWAETFGPHIQGTIDIHNELVDQDIPTFAITNFSWEKWMTRLGEWRGRPILLSLPEPSEDGLHMAVLVQAMDDGRILAAATR